MNVASLSLATVVAVLFDNDVAVVGQLFDASDIEGGRFQRLVALFQPADLLVEFGALVGCFAQPGFKLLVDRHNAFEMFLESR